MKPSINSHQKKSSIRHQLLQALGLASLLGGLNACSATEADTMCVLRSEELAMSDCDPSGITPEALELATRVNTYRQTQGLQPIPVSCELTHVAATHVRDLIKNTPHSREECNLHSWSESESWTGCCYTYDQAEANCMHKKPRELTSYDANGYEIAASGYKTPELALEGWKASNGHHDVILNKNDWADVQWNAMGAAGLDKYWSVWFGKECDTN